MIPEEKKNFVLYENKDNLGRFVKNAILKLL